MRRSITVGAVLALAGLGSCTIVSPPPPPPIPLVAVPGPAKSQAAFAQDDTACRGQAATVPAQAAYPPASPAPVGSAPAGQQMPPGAVYLQCMASRNNLVQPLAVSPPVLYGYYSAYPIYAGFGDTYPWLYGGYYGFGFYGGFGRGFGGYDRFGYGYGGGFRGGEFSGYRGGEFGGGGFGAAVSAAAAAASFAARISGSSDQQGREARQRAPKCEAYEMEQDVRLQWRDVIRRQIFRDSTGPL